MEIIRDYVSYNVQIVHVIGLPAPSPHTYTAKERVLEKSDASNRSSTHLCGLSAFIRDKLSNAFDHFVPLGESIEMYSFGTYSNFSSFIQTLISVC